MRLQRYRVTNFRSVEDSGWINVSDVSALIGVNESGKTNLLLPLWKFLPAQEGEIHPVSDYPKALFGTIRSSPKDFCFINTIFDSTSISERIALLTGFPSEQFRVISVSRHYDGKYRYIFPDLDVPRLYKKEDMLALIDRARTELLAIEPSAKEAPLRTLILNAIVASADEIKRLSEIGANEISVVLKRIEELIPETPARTSLLIPRLNRLHDELSTAKGSITRKRPNEVNGVWDTIFAALPHFVYYSNYGNLDSEIYLPHVVENLKREDLGAKEAAKARTLRVLFRFVKLSPEEILQLGQDNLVQANGGRRPTDEQIEEASERKRERSTLLQSAGTLLTGRFKDWWRQGNYRFRFEADGNFFNIWVSDDRRPDEVELEGRSTGLQWFLSFYLVFLVESQEQHSNSVLLLDEPGMSLHPLAQRDLSIFFKNLSESNQLLYTTHSPFLVDADHLDRVRKVYVDDNGKTKATEDLRHGAGEAASGAVYAVTSALNMTVAESLLIGCQPIVVEGPSDQHYLTAIKTLLISGGRLKPTRELVFPPSGGTKTIRSIANILLGRDEHLPKVLLDSDTMGRRMRSELQSTLYSECKEQVLSTGDFLKLHNSEIEDLFPAAFIAENVDRVFPRVDEDFRNAVQSNEPIVGQIEAWARRNKIELEKGWKVRLSIRVKQQALNKGLGSFDKETLDRWVALFEAISA